jgi:hypothetical protein
VIPRLVAQYAGRALPVDRAIPQQVQITQEGVMWMKPDAAPRAFTATQRIAVDRVAFAWRARFRSARVLALEVVDAYAEGAGTLEVRMLGRTLQRQVGPETSAGEALRYLAELPCAPFALAGNSELRWRERDDRRAAVSIAGQPSLEVTFEFDEAGDIVRAATPARPFRRAGAYVPIPWSGAFSDFRELDGMRIPTAAEVSSDLPAGRYVYWRGRILSALALDEPYAQGR